jgi:phosphatidylinositol kinase/protein kinase (PI-3  family)
MLCLQCCQHFPPVFRQFFLEAFPHPSDWFEARTRYTRSTAVASMAGAVIGLGDRHLGNILLDMNSAEVGTEHAAVQMGVAL